MQILNGAFHALTAQSGAVFDQLFLPFIAPNSRNHRMVEIREHFQLIFLLSIFPNILENHMLKEVN